MADRVKVTLRRSLIGRPVGQRKVAWSLGLRRLGAARVYTLTPSLRGALRRVEHLVSIEEVADEQSR